MYIDNLAISFEKVLSNFPKIQIEDLKQHLKESIKKKKYDLQDQGIIEAILEEKEKTFDESFYENLEDHLKNLDSNIDRRKYLRSEECKNIIIEIFMSDLEQFIDYYYNALINKHFT